MLIIFIVIAVIILLIFVFQKQRSDTHISDPDTQSKNQFQKQEYDVVSDLKSKLKLENTENIKFNLSSPQDRIKKNNIVIFQSFDQIGSLGLTYRSWNSIRADVSELSKYFSGIWLPPASKCTGNPGYLPNSFSDLNSYWGTENEFSDCVQDIRSQGMDAMVDIVFHHAIGSDPKNWYKLDFIDRKNPEDYLDLWQWQNNFGWSYQRTDVSKDDIIDYSNSSGNCMQQTEKGWKVNQNCVPNPDQADCFKVKPMYNIDPSVMDAGNLSALNLCNLDILKAQINYLWKLKKLGVNAFRYDQANGIPPAVFQLFNNSSPQNTRDILKRLAEHCFKARMYPNCPDVYKNQIEQQIEQLSDEQVQDFTAPPHDLAVAECFTYNVETNLAYDYPNHKWWALVPMLTNMNFGLEQQDKIGVFDFTLNRVLYLALGFDINSSKQPLCVNGSGYQNMVYFPSVTLDSNIWYQAFTTGFETRFGDSVAYNVPLVMYNNQEYCSNDPCQVFTFVSNHDNDGIMKNYGFTQDGRGYQDEGFVSYSRMELAYFILCMMPGIPVIFSAHFHWFKNIRLFLILREFLGITFDSRLSVNANDNTGNRLTWVITTPNKDVFTFAILDTVAPYPDQSIFSLPKIFETKMFASWADPAKSPILLQVYKGQGQAIR